MYALAAVLVEQDDANRIVGAALSRTQMPELKFSKLRSSELGRRNILTLLGDAALSTATAAVVVVNKPWMVAGKLVDELVEPRMLAEGRSAQWYASGEHLRMTNVLYERGRRELGSTYEEMAAAFVPMVRDYGPGLAQEFLRLLSQARIVARDQQLHAVLNAMLDSEADLRAEFAARQDALDPALPALFWQAGEWSSRIGDFEIVHDESVEVEQWAQDLVMTDPSAACLSLGQITITLPHGLRRIGFSQSDADMRLQLADVLAGAAAHVYAGLCGLGPEGDFGRALERLGIGRLIQHWLGPELPPLRMARLG